MRESRTSRIAQSIVFTIMIFVIAFAVAFLFYKAARPVYPKDEIISNPIGYIQVSQSQRINVYVFKDTEKGKEYLIDQLGGICPREQSTEVKYYE